MRHMWPKWPPSIIIEHSPRVANGIVWNILKGCLPGCVTRNVYTTYWVLTITRWCAAAAITWDMHTKCSSSYALSRVKIPRLDEKRCDIVSWRNWFKRGGYRRYFSVMCAHGLTPWSYTRTGGHLANVIWPRDAEYLCDMQGLWRDWKSLSNRRRAHTMWIYICGCLGSLRSNK